MDISARIEMLIYLILDFLFDKACIKMKSFSTIMFSINGEKA